MAVAVRSYSRMIGHTSLEQNTGMLGAHWPISRCSLPFVRRIAIGMQQPQDDPFGAERDRLVERLAQARRIERPVDRFRPRASAHAPAARGRA